MMNILSNILLTALLLSVCHGAKEYFLYNGGAAVKGTANTDTNFLYNLCNAEGLVPATIDSAVENDAFLAKCATTGVQNCWIGITRSDPTTTDWIEYDGTTPIYNGWAGGQGTPQGTGGEQCVVSTSGGSHDYPCGLNAKPLICQQPDIVTDPRTCSTKSNFINAWFDGSSANIVNNEWTDKSGSNNNGIIGGSGIGLFNGADQNDDRWLNYKPVLYGTAVTTIELGPNLNVPATHTVFNVCKYRPSGSKQRIIDAWGSNSLFGFWMGRSGVAHELHWITSGQHIDRFGNDWVLSSQTHHLYRGNGRDDLTSNPNIGDITVGRLTINNGNHRGSERSDWACAEIIISTQELDLDEIKCIEEYLSCKYDLGFYPCLGSNGASNGAVDCVVSGWTDTSVCSEECGPNGQKTQERQIIEENANGGSRGECDDLQQEISCNTDKLCGNGCEYKGNPGYGLSDTAARPGLVSGDPHTAMFNGFGHDFQGGTLSDNYQFYYMHPCRYDRKDNSISRNDMPFGLLGKHYSLRKDTLGVRGLDYITFELFDTDGKIYYVWLSSYLHSYADSAVAGNSLYDEVTADKRTDLISRNDLTQIGNTGRFKMKYLQTIANAKIAVTLIIDDKCSVELTMTKQWVVRDGRYRMHLLIVQPPQCYKCYTCGLFGDFLSNAPKDRLRTCGHGLVKLTKGWQPNNPTAYEKRALTWEKTVVKDNCDWSRRRRLPVDDTSGDVGEPGVEIQAEIDPAIADQIEDPMAHCVGQPRIDTEAACAAAKTANQQCCDQVPTTCNKFEADCIVDVCAIADIGGNIVEAATPFQEELTDFCNDADAVAAEVAAEAEDNVDPADDNDIDCFVTAWSDFDECSKRYCGGGTQKRVRTIDVPPANAGKPCPILEETRNCNIDNCCPTGADTFNWDTMTEKGENIPNINVPIFEVIEDDLSLKVVVELDYVGAATADQEESANFGVTYVLDFEDYNAHKDHIYEPGTCQNRKKESFDGKTFDKFWDYSLEPQNDDNIGTDTYLAYPPPPDDKWIISMKDDECDTVRYEGHFTWNELRGCTAMGGGDSYTSVSADNEWLNLTGTFYVNLVSPFWYGDEDTGFYRVYQLWSQPFVIAVSSTVYVLGSTGINLMTMSIIAVYKEDDESDFKLVVMTETADYMKLIRDTNSKFEFIKGGNNNNNMVSTDFDASTSAENANCLENKDFLCSQLWEIEAADIFCEKDVSGTDFSGTYAMTFNAKCKDGTYKSYCDEWLIDHPKIGNQEISLSAPLVWKDDICDPKVFTVQLESEMFFYAHTNKGEDVYHIDNKVDTKSYLYAVGEDRIYVEVVTDFPDATLSIFNTELVNVWICTFAPEINVPSPTKPDGTLEPLATMGCFNTQRDSKYDGDFYHIFSTTQTIQIDHGFNEEKENEDSDIERFSFIVPNEVARDTLYVHVQIEVELQELTRRRRMLLNVGKTANKIQHFGDEIGIDHGQKHEPQNEPKPNDYYYPNDISSPIQPIQPPQPSTFVLSLSSPWIIIIASLLALILIVNIAFMFYMNCCNKRGPRRPSPFRARKKGRYASVKNGDSEDFEESEINAINVISQ